MNIFGDKDKPVYEVEINNLNILTGRYDHCWDYVHAGDVQEAKDIVHWLHGSCCEILSVELDN